MLISILVYGIQKLKWTLQWTLRSVKVDSPKVSKLTVQEFDWAIQQCKSERYKPLEIDRTLTWTLNNLNPTVIKQFWLAQPLVFEL